MIVVVVMVVAVVVAVAVVIEEVVALLGSAFGFQRLLIRILQGRRTSYLFMKCRALRGFMYQQIILNL